MKAFPLSSPRDLSKPADNKVNPLERGMDMRDYFAAKAMQALCSMPSDEHNMSNSEIAKASYAMADAMMLGREGIFESIKQKKTEEVLSKPQFGDPVIKMEEPAKPKKAVKKNGTN